MTSKKRKVTTKTRYSQVREELKNRRSKVHITKKEFQMIVEAQETGDWSEVYKTKLYAKYGGEFCETQLVMRYIL